jgi:hypothetical protein
LRCGRKFYKIFFGVRDENVGLAVDFDIHGVNVCGKRIF